MTFIDTTPIPHIDTAKEPFHDAHELRQRWRALMGPLGFSERLLWFLFVDEGGYLLPAANQLELPDKPPAEVADVLLSRLTDIVSQEAVTVAFLLSRPGSDGVSAEDHEWARALIAAAARHRVGIHPIHRANNVAVVTMPEAVDIAA